MSLVSLHIHSVLKAGSFCQRKESEVTPSMNYHEIYSHKPISSSSLALCCNVPLLLQGGNPVLNIYGFVYSKVPFCLCSHLSCLPYYSYSQWDNNFSAISSALTRPVGNMFVQNDMTWRRGYHSSPILLSYNRGRNTIISFMNNVSPGKWSSR